MIEKKSLINSIKRALQTGTFNYIGQQVKQIPRQLFHIDQINFEDQNWWQCLPITKIDASNNQIVEIPSEVVNLPDIQLIRMKNNQVKQLNVNVLRLQFIKSIDLTRNCLCELPKQLSANRTLVELNFAQNMIELCPDLSQIQTLEHVYFSDNRLKQLPNFGKGLRKLQASSNKIRCVRKSNFSSCALLQALNLNKNQIQQIQPTSFSKLSNLILLQLKQNKVSQFQQIPKSQKLDTINLAFNNLKQYNYFANSPNLTVLILSNNKITRISKEVMKLQKLKTLDVQNNDLSELPYELGFINSLVRLQVEGNPLKSIRQNIKNGGTNILKKYLKDRMPPQEQQNLQKKYQSSFQQQGSQKQHWNKLIHEFNQGGQLMLRNMKVAQVDSLVYTKNLKGMNFSDNQIKQLSQQISQLSSLKYLIINKNILQSLPSSLGTIATLESIQAKNNRISTFGSLKDHSMNKYPALRHLDLSGNKFTQVPRNILLIKNLRTLYISYNQIKSIDPIWHQQSLPFLQVLDVSNNALTDLSDQVYSKGGLNFLNVENNSLTKIPTLLGFMKLSSLKVDGNPLKLIKRAVIDKGTVALLQFLRTKHVGEVPQAVQAPIQEKIQIQESIQQWPYQPNRQNNRNVGHRPVENAHQTRQKQSNNQSKYEQIPEELPKNNSYNQSNSQFDTQQLNINIKKIQKQIYQVQFELQNNYSLSNVKKNQKKKFVQALMIEKNRLMKERDGY